MAVLRAYLDESKSHEESAIMNVAGYLFTSEGSSRFDTEWGNYLFSRKMARFHACADSHRPDAPEIFSKLREVTKETAVWGFTRFAQHDQVQVLNDINIRQRTGSAYAMLTLSCMEQIAERAKLTGDKVWFFLEAGGPQEQETRDFLKRIGESTELTKTYAYFKSDIVGKDECIQLQTADLAAWSLSRAYRDRDIPGLDGAKGWMNFYLDQHTVSGYSVDTVWMQAAKNATDGFQKLFG